MQWVFPVFLTLAVVSDRGISSLSDFYRVFLFIYSERVWIAVAIIIIFIIVFLTLPCEYAYI
jgi:hypothetical protein